MGLTKLFKSIHVFSADNHLLPIDYVFLANCTFRFRTNDRVSTKCTLDYITPKRQLPPLIPTSQLIIRFVHSSTHCTECSLSEAGDRQCKHSRCQFYISLAVRYACDRPSVLAAAAEISAYLTVQSSGDLHSDHNRLSMTQMSISANEIIYRVIPFPTTDVVDRS